MVVAGTGWEVNRRAVVWSVVWYGVVVCVCVCCGWWFVGGWWFHKASFRSFQCVGVCTTAALCSNQQTKNVGGWCLTARFML